MRCFPSLRPLPYAGFVITVSIFCLSILPFHSAEAHPLIPKEVLSFLEEHPDATPLEIETFYKTLPNQDASTISMDQFLSAVEVQDRTMLENMGAFVYLGIIHILAGLDHILFLCSLVLVFVSLRRTLALASVFTVAHTITFIIAGTHLLTISPRIVEPLIALSISYMAFTTVFLKKFPFFSGTKQKAGVVFAFGLFHGLGFAGLLDEIAIPAGRFLESLLFFNVGIELGQLLILACVIPLIIIITPYKWYPRFQQGAAMLLIAAGLLWFVERVFAV